MQAARVDVDAPHAASGVGRTCMPSPRAAISRRAARAQLVGLHMDAAQRAGVLAGGEPLGHALAVEHVAAGLDLGAGPARGDAVKAYAALLALGARRVSEPRGHLAVAEDRLLRLGGVQPEEHLMILGSELSGLKAPHLGPREAAGEHLVAAAVPAKGAALPRRGKVWERAGEREAEGLEQVAAKGLLATLVAMRGVPELVAPHGSSAVGCTAAATTRWGGRPVGVPPCAG
eukprot:CAMPEP_0206002624 /NCGR_PEP_ID=MMETSP1464-20131121/2861_1 /ASSEMBLY_ACC=CAM_ASM_001124 /TAXON_ID=119497 /ORGANISM="Exanthemachrysis gayraliae, Strain RCC1523" /LENGTH=230 /DNA_ID=CAMNT_0053375971 /DNA_START=169 /DNA_END=858 /DNA_ORIENTATION=+